MQRAGGDTVLTACRGRSPGRVLLSGAPYRLLLRATQQHLPGLPGHEPQGGRLQGLPRAVARNNRINRGLSKKRCYDSTFSLILPNADRSMFLFIFDNHRI